jgi:hypothetical protein
LIEQKRALDLENEQRSGRGVPLLTVCGVPVKMIEPDLPPMVGDHYGRKTDLKRERDEIEPPPAADPGTDGATACGTGTARAREFLDGAAVRFAAATAGDP